MSSFFCVIYAMGEAVSHLKLVLEVNKPFSASFQTVCVWKKEVIAGFVVGDQVIITFKKIIYSIHSFTEMN